MTGTASLNNGNVTEIIQAGTFVSRQYPILNVAGSITGTLKALPTFGVPFDVSLSYDPHTVILNLQLSFGAGLSANQQGVANALTSSFNANGGIPAAFAATPAGLTQIAGPAATTSQPVAQGAMTQFMGVIGDLSAAGRGGDGGNGGLFGNGGNGNNGGNDGNGGLLFGNGGKGGSGSDLGNGASSVAAYASESRDVPRALHAGKEREAYAAMRAASATRGIFAQRWNVWAMGYGGAQTTDGNAAQGTNTTTSRILGMAVGADYWFSRNTIAGFALGGGGTSFGVANGLGGGRSDLFQAGAFVRHNAGAAYITSAAAYGWQSVTTDRTVTVAGIDQLRAQFNTNTWSGRVEGGYRFVVPVRGGVGLTPYAAVQATVFDLPAYAESVVAGANTLALSYDAKSVTDTRSELGLRTDKSYAVNNGILTLRGRAAWAHDFNPDHTIAATFQTLPGASFVVNGAAGARDLALTTTSAEMNWLNGWSASASFEGEFSSLTRSYAGKGLVRYAW